MYDTLIIGRDLSSLVAAVTSVKRGHKTLLIMEGDTGIVHQGGGYLFPFAPRPLSGLIDRQWIAPLFQNPLSASALEPLPSPMNPAFQVILPNHRVELFGSQPSLVDELTREFPEQKHEIGEFYRAVAKASPLIERRLAEETSTDSLNGKTRLRRLLSFPAEWAAHSQLKLPSGDSANGLRRTIQAQLKFLSHLTIDDDRLPLSAAYLLSLPYRGLFYPHHGGNTLTSKLCRAFTDAGGVLHEGGSVIRVETRPEIMVDFEWKGSSSSLRGRRLIVSAQWEKLDLLLPLNKGFFHPARRFRSLTTTGFPFYLHMGVRSEGLPEKMAEYAVVVADGKGAVLDRDLVFLETSPPGDTKRAPEGRRALTATVMLPDSPLRLSNQELKEAATRIVDSLEPFLPFLRESIDYLHVDQSIAVSRNYQDIADRKYRVLHRPFWGTTTLSPRTRTPNVLLTGAILRAGLGFEGEIIAGIDAALKAGREIKRHG